MSIELVKRARPRFLWPLGLVLLRQVIALGFNGGGCDLGLEDGGVAKGFRSGWSLEP